MTDIVLKPGRDKSARNRHPWIFSGAIAQINGQRQPGGLVTVRDAGGRFVAHGYDNVRSQIAVRLLTWREDEKIGPSFWRARLQAAIDRRATLVADAETDAYRLVNAESDGLPGLIVDRYGDWLVLQALTLGIDQRKHELATTLAELLPVHGVYERSDVDVRRHEGLGPAIGPLVGEAPPCPLVIRENGLLFQVDLLQGHKTGFYLDQRVSRARLGAYAAGAELLNVFCYTGGFSAYAARAGATSCCNLDSSAGALAMAQENMALNGLPPAETLEGDAFQLLRDLWRQGRTFDLVVLDPPKFAQSQRQVERATRGYKDINMLGMRLLRPGGTLCTFSCSGLVSEDLFQKVLFGAAVDVDREVRIMERLAQGPDHPVLLTFPEGAYLKGFVCRVE
jgi:23S rRNA (cytosine1962-C5)-methyltransferase